MPIAPAPIAVDIATIVSSGHDGETGSEATSDGVICFASTLEFSAHTCD